MGLYNDNSNINRFEWKFTYQASELLEAVRKKYREFHSKEKEARAKLAELMVDMNVTQSDTRIAELRREIESAGLERERCAAWVHEFSRNPEREFYLRLGDVTYFDLAAEPELSK
ncbi:MAG: hypothetical protein QM758_01655 [Armatimonas sp.]